MRIQNAYQECAPVESPLSVTLPPRPLGVFRVSPGSRFCLIAQLRLSQRKPSLNREDGSWAVRSAQLDAHVRVLMGRGLTQTMRCFWSCKIIECNSAIKYQKNIFELSFSLFWWTRPRWCRLVLRLDIWDVYGGDNHGSEKPINRKKYENICARA